MLMTRRFFQAIPSNPELQISADSLVAWTEQNHMRVNESKTKEMLIYFGTKHNPSELARIHINSKEIERVESFKLLGIVLSSDLSWSAQDDYMLRKVAKRMYCIHYLVRARVKDTDVLTIYCSVIRTVLEYACPVWHPGLTQKQSDEIEKIQKRCLKLIYPNLSYNHALATSGLTKLQERRETITRELFNEIKDHRHVLHSILPMRDPNSLRSRNPYQYLIPITKPTRFGRAFVPYCISRRY